MTYQALARRWRPGRFDDVVGQEHVVSALTHALDNDRVHHAFLFTGTRGVGKTTLARLLAKSLNCERGVSSKPCGECSACTSIDQGRFIDLLEVDAASRTRVDDTRELLDNVQYAPTMGHYKVYLIDEVHMLSTHSFNALLKTLEEPPPHVKFLLATTDPQKLPATILSRCLQFNLRALNNEEISRQLEFILDAEKIEFESSALDLLARAASGSMRDALSLLDQAIAFSGSNVSGERVRRMLGMMEGSYISDLLFAINSNETDKLFATLDLMRARSIDFSKALDDLLVLLYEIALTRGAPDVSRERSLIWPEAEELSRQISPERVQLYYQIVLIGKRDLPLAPDSARGFEMTMLRLLAFEPDLPSRERPRSTESAVRKPPGNDTPVRSAVQYEMKGRNPPDTGSTRLVIPERKTDASQRSPVAAHPTTSDIASAVVDAKSWGLFVESSKLKGITRELAMNLALDEVKQKIILLGLRESLAHLYNKNRHGQLERAVQARFGEDYRLQVATRTEKNDTETPAVQRERRRQTEHAEAVEGMRNDPNVQTFINQFDAEVVPESVLPAKHRGN